MCIGAHHSINIIVRDRLTNNRREIIEFYYTIQSYNSFEKEIEDHISCSSDHI